LGQAEKYGCFGRPGTGLLAARTLAGVDHRRLGLAGVRVSVIGLGCNWFGRTVYESGLAPLLDTALALDVNFIDTTPELR
jgi:hypothetical protein